MECKRIRYLMSLYIDGEASREESLEVLEHLNGCSECEKYYEKLMESHEGLNRFSQNEKLTNECKDNIMKEVNKVAPHIYEEKKCRKSSYKWKIAVSVAIIALIMIVPINGKTVLATVSDWVSSLFIEKDGITIGAKVKNSEKEESKGTPLKYKQTSIDDIGQLKDLEKNINRPLVTGYMIEGYEFFKGYIREFEEDNSKYTIDVMYSPDGSYNNSISIYFTCYKDYKYNYMSWSEYGNKDVVSKEVEILDTKGIITRDKRSDSFNEYISYYLDVIEGRYPIDFRISSNNLSNENFNGEYIEKELIKIAESLLERIYNELEEVEEIKNIPNIKFKQ